MSLPRLRDDLRDFEKLAGLSVDVILRIDGAETLSIGRYIHAIDEWQINGWHGSPKVAEWWYLPEAGTGNNPKEAP